MLWDTARAVAAGTSMNNAADPTCTFDVFTADWKAMADGHYSAVEIPCYLLTRRAKTFYPRAVGHQACKIAIMDLW